MGWYTLTHGRDPVSADSYTFTGNHPPCCSGHQQICAINACGCDCLTISAVLLEEMVWALQNKTSTQNVILKNC